MADTQLIHREVEQELLEKGVKQPRERLDGEPIYCFEYSKSMLDFDNWDYLVQSKYCCRNGLTISPFDKPPKLVLDMGCGAGLWTIEAAKQWTESEIVGFDFLKNYPENGLPEALAKRITWVQGNFLQPLPFPSNYFDLVRSVRTGFHVPENEGHKMLEEVFRVMKPGAVVEMIEEDLIFPHAQPSRVFTKQPQKIPMETIPEHPIYSSQDLQDPTGSYGYAKQSSLANLSMETLIASPTSSRSSGFSRTVLHPIETDREFDTTSTPFRLSESEESEPPVDPRDHSQLKEAWEAMLDKYFLTARITSVLQHYFSTIFFDVKCHAPIQVILPPNSEQYQKSPGRQAPALKASEIPGPNFYFDHENEYASPTRDDRSSIKSQRPKKITSLASMHLARTVCTVMGCKEKIWDAYLELFGNQLSTPRVVRSPADAVNPVADRKFNQCQLGIVRDAFETAWANWESDMKDRIGTRGMISGCLEWAEPEGDIPDWQVWRDSLETAVKKEDGDTDKDSCRVIRAFVGWKPLSN